MWKLFNLKKLHEVEVKEYYLTKMSNRFAAFDSLYDRGNTQRAWKVTIREYIKISAKNVWVTTAIYSLSTNQQILFVINGNICQHNLCYHDTIT
jgi:hypothetical protein